MIKLKNPFRKIYVEVINEMPNFRLYHGTNFLETYTYETRWLFERLRFWQLKKPFEKRFLGTINEDEARADEDYAKNHYN